MWWSSSRDAVTDEEDGISVGEITQVDVDTLDIGSVISLVLIYIYIYKSTNVYESPYNIYTRPIGREWCIIGILSTGSLVWHIYFWIGEKATLDKKGEALQLNRHGLFINYLLCIYLKYSNILCKFICLLYYYVYVTMLYYVYLLCIWNILCKFICSFN